MKPEQITSAIQSILPEDGCFEVTDVHAHNESKTLDVTITHVKNQRAKTYTHSTEYTGFQPPVIGQIRSDFENPEKMKEIFEVET